MYKLTTDRINGDSETEKDPPTSQKQYSVKDETNGRFIEILGLCEKNNSIPFLV